MKKIFTLLVLLFFAASGTALAQPSCNVLGCAGNYGTINVDASGADATDANLGCYSGLPYKQVYWQYFYSPTAGNFTQTYHQTSTGSDLNLNFVVFDAGTSIPTVTCPVDASAWTQTLCAITDRGSADVGPGLNGDNLTTTAGHFYVIAIIAWDGTDPSYTFTIGTPQLDGVDLTSANCPATPPSCVALGCAANYSTITASTIGPNVNDPNMGCHGPFDFKQVYWQFFYAPTSDVFTQTYHQTSAGSDLNLNFVVFDMGISTPPSQHCPVDASGWTEALCAITDRGSADVGPGLNGDNLTTTAGHYYAIAIIVWDATDPSYTFTIGTPQLGGVDLTSVNCDNIVLPVKLTSFDATVNNCAVNLNWAAQSESNFKSYEVENSSDGKNFKSIAIITANVSGKYSYHESGTKQGKGYYRLKMIDIDGKIAYSKIITLNIDCSNNSLIVYPNPVLDVLNVNIANVNDHLPVAELFDNSGRLIYKKRMVNGTNKIDMTKLAKGIYILTLKSDVETQNVKIIK